MIPLVWLRRATLKGRIKMASSIKKVYYWIKIFTLIPISLKTLARIIRSWETHTDKYISRNLFFFNIKKTSTLAPCLICFEMLYMTSQLCNFLLCSCDVAWRAILFNFRLDVANSIFLWKINVALALNHSLVNSLKMEGNERKFKIRIENNHQFHKDDGWMGLYFDDIPLDKSICRY